MKAIILIVLFFVSSLINAEEKLNIYSVNYPLAFFAEQIAGEHAEVNFPVPKDIDPAFWKPDVNTIIQYQNADLILLNGAGYAKWINEVSLPPSKLVDTSLAFKDQYIHIINDKVHRHGPKGDHSHIGITFTTWLDLQLAIKQAETIKLAIIKKRPQYRKIIEQNYLELEKVLLTIDQKLQDVFSKYTEQPLLASHPVYQYLARRYGLDLESILWEPDVYPDENEWQNFELILKDHPARYMLWEAEPAAETVDHLNQHDVKVIVFNPGANKYNDGDFISIIMQNVENLSLSDF